MGNLEYDIIGVTPEMLHYVIDFEQNSSQADQQVIDIVPLLVGPGTYDNEAFQGDTDAYILTVAEANRADRATVYGGTWTITVTRSYIQRGIGTAAVEPVVIS